MSMHKAPSQENQVDGVNRVWQILAFFGTIAAAVTALGWAAFVYLMQRERYLMQVELARLIVATKK
ncbi:MAG: hypothetical protein ACRDHZ_23405 [Ktedonobacteraceae bacterium]